MKTLWVGLQSGVEPVVALGQSLAALSETSEAVSQKFHAHLTLGRVKNPIPSKTFRTLFDAWRFEPFPPIPVNSIELMRSVLGTSGPAYTVVRSVPLKNN